MRHTPIYAQSGYNSITIRLTEAKVRATGLILGESGSVSAERPTRGGTADCCTYPVCTGKTPWKAHFRYIPLRKRGNRANPRRYVREKCPRLRFGCTYGICTIRGINGEEYKSTGATKRRPIYSKYWMDSDYALRVNRADGFTIVTMNGSPTIPLLWVLYKDFRVFHIPSSSFMARRRSKAWSGVMLLRSAPLRRSRRDSRSGSSSWNMESWMLPSFST